MYSKVHAFLKLHVKTKIDKSFRLNSIVNLSPEVGMLKSNVAYCKIYKTHFYSIFFQKELQ